MKEMNEMFNERYIVICNETKAELVTVNVEYKNPVYNLKCSYSFYSFVINMKSAKRRFAFSLGECDAEQCG